MERSKKRKSLTIYSESFKRMIVVEFESGLLTKASLRRKYGILGHGSIDNWLKKYGKFDYVKYKSIGRPMKDKDKQYIKELEAKLRVNERLLKKQLKEKDDQLNAYRQFIEIAERELNIKIVKKSGTNQSKK